MFSVGKCYWLTLLCWTPHFLDAQASYMVHWWKCVCAIIHICEGWCSEDIFTSVDGQELEKELLAVYDLVDKMSAIAVDDHVWLRHGHSHGVGCWPASSVLSRPTLTLLTSNHGNRAEGRDHIRQSPVSYWDLFFNLFENYYFFQYLMLQQIIFCVNFWNLSGNN